MTHLELYLIPYKYLGPHIAAIASSHPFGWVEGTETDPRSRPTRCTGRGPPRGARGRLDAQQGAALGPCAAAWRPGRTEGFNRRGFQEEFGAESSSIQLIVWVKLEGPKVGFFIGTKSKQYR